MEHFYQLGWTLDSAGGASGEAYMAEQDGRKLFLKRNSSPFLAALSAEGIVPKLVWTKRIETGEVCNSTALEEWAKSDAHGNEIRTCCTTAEEDSSFETIT